MRRILILSMLALLQLGALRVVPVGKLKTRKAPTFLELSRDGRRLFVTNFASDEVLLLDPADLKGKGTRFYAGVEPLGVALTPDGHKLFVTSFRSGLVKVVDARTFDILDDIKVGGVPSNVLISRGGALAFVTNFGRGKIGHVDIIDTGNHRQLGQVEVGIRPLAAAVSPLDDQLYVVCGGSNDLYVINIQAREVVQQLPVGVAPDGVAVSPDGTVLYVANSGTNDISVIDLLDLKETRRVPVGEKPFSLAVDGQGNLYVVETGSRTLSVFSPRLEKLTTVRAGKKPIDVILSPDERHLYVTDEKDNRVHVFEIQRGR